VYVHDVARLQVTLELSDPPSLMVPRVVESLSEPEQVFLLARPLAVIAQGLQLVDRVPGRDLEFLMTAAGRNVSPDYGLGDHDEATLSDGAKRVLKSLPRRSRRGFEEAAVAYVSQGKPDFSSWVRQCRMTACRAAAILADDLASSVGIMRRREAELSGPAQVQAKAIHDDAILFALSDAAMSLRRRLGIVLS
jgi:hypothetical protein